MEQLKIEWTVINSKLVKYMTSLVNKRIEKAYIKLPSKTLSDKYNNVVKYLGDIEIINNHHQHMVLDRLILCRACKLPLS